MESIDPQAATQLLQTQLQPWHNAVDSPTNAQEQVLHRLLVDYARTDYGVQQGASNIENINDYRRAFPAQGYEDYKPMIDQVMAGDEGALLTESPVGWAITRGTTKGESKFIPLTPKDLQGRISAGRAMMNYILESKRFELFSGVNLNLNFPSVVGKVEVGGRQIEYGYSSGIYAKIV